MSLHGVRIAARIFGPMTSITALAFSFCREGTSKSGSFRGDPGDSSLIDDTVFSFVNSHHGDDQMVVFNGVNQPHPLLTQLDFVAPRQFPMQFPAWDMRVVQPFGQKLLQGRTNRTIQPMPFF